MITIVAALASNRVLAKDGKLPWNLPKELKNFYNFVKKTLIISGYNTFKAMQGPAKGGAAQWVLTRKHASVEALSLGTKGANRSRLTALIAAQKLKIFKSSAELLNAAKAASSKGLDLSVIGGEAVFKLFLPVADQLKLTVIAKECAGDVHFPAIDLATWRLERLTSHQEGKIRYQQTLWRRDA